MVKRRILHVRDADAILHVKTSDLNVDVLIANIIRKLNFRKMNLLYLILYGDQHSNFACSIAPQKSCIIQKSKKIYNTKNVFFKKTFDVTEFFKILQNVSLHCL